MGFLRGQFLVFCFLMCTCYHLGLSFSNTTSPTIQMLMIPNYLFISSDDPSPVNYLTCCISNIKNWMAQNFLTLNDAKTEILVVGPKALRNHFQPILTSLLAKPCVNVTNLGVTLDADLNFQKHISNIAKTAFTTSEICLKSVASCLYRILKNEFMHLSQIG